MILIPCAVILVILTITETDEMKMTVETVRNVVSRFFNKERGDDPWIIDCETAPECPVYSELKNANILDARIIRGTCPTCKDAGKPPLREATRVELNVPDRDPCPDCANAPVWVIEPAAWEAFVDTMTAALSEAYVAGAARPDKITDFVALRLGAQQEVLQALLPGARVAEAVGKFYDPGNDTERPWLDCPGPMVDIEEGDTIAILATQAREEVEE